MSEVIKSAWWIIYYLEEWEPKFLIIKRLSRANKIEWVAPKWKINKWENIEDTVVREIWEETWIPINFLKIQDNLWVIELRMVNKYWPDFSKDITYFLVEFLWDPSEINIENAEWYVWVYKWADIQNILWLLFYENLREIFRKAYILIKNKNKKNEIKSDFIKKYL